MRGSEPDRQEQEYLRLWDATVTRVSPLVLHLIASGEAQKFSADELSVQAQLTNDVVDLRKELSRLDTVYAEKIELLQRRERLSEDHDDQSERIADYLQALLIGLDKDLTKTPELMEILKNIRV